ncbi:CAP domain-containing protein [Streptomyces sp. NPDC058459]|uniref:CAP domain-containing protein n=1 Tax=Streptomyces sp. NPDC058459 TaxID=3346508 RepID=UPI00364985F3
MGKHRKNQQYRRVLIAAVAVAGVGVPTAAVACVDWKGDPGQQTEATAWRTEQAPRHEWRSAPKQDRAPGATASESPAAEPASASPSVHTHHRSAPAPAPTHHRTARTKAAKPAAKPTARTARPAAARPTSVRPTSVRPTTAKPAAAPGPATARPTTAPEPAATKPVSAPTKPVSAPTVRPVSGPPRPTQTAPTAAPSTPKPAATASGDVARVVELVNAERTKAGCSPVQLNSTLSKAAQDHSADMAAHNTMSHTGSDGSDPGSRITAAGYRWSAYGENVAYGYSTPEQVMAGWMNSTGHRENILNCSFKEIGVGLAQPGSYWTQDFGTAR